MQCRSACGACCIAPSISSAIPGMPNGKAAGERCIHLQYDFRCALFGHESRPKVCLDFGATPETCGDNQAQALFLLDRLERLTAIDTILPNQGATQ